MAASKRDRIRQDVVAALAQGTYGPEDKLPSARELAVRHHCSLATAQQALTSLKQAGVIEGRQGDGYYPSPHGTVPPDQDTQTRLTRVEETTVDLDERTGFLEAAVMRLYADAGIPWPGTTQQDHAGGQRGNRDRPASATG